jgi:hypothetical protein
VWPRPRPDTIGTATPHAATAGASGIEILSPTPPVECLSTLGRKFDVLDLGIRGVNLSLLVQCLPESLGSDALDRKSDLFAGLNELIVKLTGVIHGNRGRRLDRSGRRLEPGAIVRYLAPGRIPGRGLANAAHPGCLDVADRRHAIPFFSTQLGPAGTSCFKVTHGPIPVNRHRPIPGDGGLEPELEIGLHLVVQGGSADLALKLVTEIQRCVLFQAQEIGIVVDAQAFGNRRDIAQFLLKIVIPHGKPLSQSRDAAISPRATWL